MAVVDFHTHVFPAKMILRGAGRFEKLKDFRKQARKWIKPIAENIHASQPFLRIIPGPIRRTLDELGILAPLAGLVFESTPQDLRDAMQESGVDYSLVIAQPPHLSNETLLEICARHPEFIPVVNIPPGTKSPSEKLRTYVKKGARVLNIHPAFDGEGVKSPHYHKLLKTASELSVPIILHTGYVQSRILYKDPVQGRAEIFKPWFETYKNVQFILAHMNVHEPEIALRLAEDCANVSVDTSWQPSETIGEAVRRLGAKKVYFGSDWPLVGNNIDVGIQRISACIEGGMVTRKDAELILGKNAECLLNLPSSPRSKS
jgi:predicted TIM-barrel fold metal-dependent hydrolase